MTRSEFVVKQIFSCDDYYFLVEDIEGDNITIRQAGTKHMFCLNEIRHELTFDHNMFARSSPYACPRHSAIYLT